MPTVFHGTKHADATTMAGPASGNGTIDVSRGGGEFGKGFYTQKKRAHAMAWAINRFSPSDLPCVLKLEVDDGKYLALDVKLLDLKDARKLTQKLRQQKRTKSHTEGKDVVAGPLNLDPRREQQKFESSDAEDLLNGPDTQREVP